MSRPAYGEAAEAYHTHGVAGVSAGGTPAKARDTHAPGGSGRRNGVRKGRLWKKLCTFVVGRRKLSMRNLERFAREHGTERLTLVVHSEFAHARFFPRTMELPRRKQGTEVYYDDLASIPDAEYEVVLCTGLLEHMKDPARLLGECHRILQPGGTMLLSASAAFSFHRGPENYFHFTPHGVRHLLRDWSSIDVRGSSQPFETLGILLQRILLQCEIFPPARPVLELIARSLWLFDVLIIRQYDSRSALPERRIDSMLPSNVQVVAVK